MCCRCTSSPARRRARAGTSVVEIMIASVVLAVLALGAAASIEKTRVGTTQQRNRRTALEMANSRLEQLRQAAYTQVRPASQNYNVYYLSNTGGTWSSFSTDPNEQVVLYGNSRPMRTQVQYVDVDGGAASYDGLKLTVRVQYLASSEAFVELETLKSP